MSYTCTLWIDLEKLLLSENRGSIIIRLMMACNDIALANTCLGEFKKREFNRIHKHVQRGARLYFVNLQCGHLNEGMKIIQEIMNDQFLYGRVNKCSQKSQDAFTELKNCLKGGVNHEKFKQYIMRVRHKVIFHYDNKNCSKYVLKALDERAKTKETRLGKVTLGNHIKFLRFELADDIIDTIVCRYIWQVPKSANFIEEVNKVADFGADLGKCFVQFGGEYIHRYVRQYSAI